MKEEIITGIKNGMARGESLDQAVQTLISAGYNPEEVSEAANSLNTGVLSKMALPQTPTTIQNIQNAIKPELTEQTTQQKITPTYQPLPTQTEKKKIPKTLIIALITLGAFLLTLGLLMIFGEKILDLIA